MSDQTRGFRKILVSPRFQLRFLSYFVGLFVFSSLSFYAVISLFFWRFQKKALAVGIPEGHVFYDFLNGQKASVNELFLLALIINFILLLILVVILTHRVAGPIEKLKGHLQNPTDEEFKLRKDDFFQEIVSLVNKKK